MALLQHDVRNAIRVGRTDSRIDCKAARHSDGDRGAVLAHLEAELREPRRRSSADCSSTAIAVRANKRRFDNLLQQLDCRVYMRNSFFTSLLATCLLEERLRRASEPRRATLTPTGGDGGRLTPLAWPRVTMPLARNTAPLR
jgi:hypothetical protein